MLVPGASVQRQGQTGASLERVPQAGLLCIYTLAAVFGLLFTAPEGARAPRLTKSEGRTVLAPREASSLRLDDGLVLGLPESGTEPVRHSPGAFVALVAVASPRVAVSHALPLSRAPPLAG